MKRFHRPKRSCLGCGQRDEPDRMVRLAAEPDHTLKARRTGEGRGGYLHPDPQCWDGFVKRKSVYRAFRMEISREARKRLVGELTEL